MFIKNNSDNEWKDYNCGDGIIITIKPKSTFEVSSATGVILLRNLGSEKWLTVTDVGPTQNKSTMIPASNMEKHPEALIKKIDIEKEVSPISKKK